MPPPPSDAHVREENARLLVLYFTVLEPLCRSANCPFSRELCDNALNRKKSDLVCPYTVLANQVMHITLFCLQLFYVAAGLLSCCFRQLKTSNHHLRRISGRNILQKTFRWSSGYPAGFDAVIQLTVYKLLLSLCLHGCERFMVTRTEFHFDWV